MNRQTRFGISMDSGFPGLVSIRSFPERQSTVLEATKKATDVDQSMLATLLESLFHNQDEEDSRHEERGKDELFATANAGMAVRCETLTRKIIELERRRQKVIHIQEQHSQLSDVLCELLASLIARYDWNIRACEDELDDIIEPNRRRAAVCGLIADYYVG